MIKVFLVDDEIAIRENLRNSFPWEKEGFQLVGEAPDGEMALPMIRDLETDILLTDIRMPFMDGIRLCEEVQRTMPWVERIILSGYDDFSYAQRAISLGVRKINIATASFDALARASKRFTSGTDAPDYFGLSAANAEAVYENVKRHITVFNNK